MSHLDQNVKYIEHSRMRYGCIANKLNFNMVFSEQKYAYSFKSYAQFNLLPTFGFFTADVKE